VARKQCKKCPWKTSTNPHEIPHGYSETKHKALKSTIASSPESSLADRDHFAMMACHESRLGKEQVCVGWLHNQLGVGNNIALRLAVITGRVDADIEIVGPQHECFEDTLP